MKSIIRVIVAVCLLMAAAAQASEQGGISAELKSRYYGGVLCAYKQFNCIKVKPGDTWAKLFPDKRQRDLVKRLNRMNLPLRYRQWIVVPTDLAHVDYFDLSPFPSSIKPANERLVIVNLSLHAFGAYNREGKLVRWGPVSGGKGWCPDIKRPCNTATGEFRFFNKRGPECISETFPVETNGGAPMPYCMNYFRGFALHGSTLPGFHASHGCIRLFHEDAKWLNQNFVDVGTRVIVMK